jgi:hypothetical protein
LRLVLNVALFGEILMKKITHRSTYHVGAGQVHLTVTIGEGQFGSSTVVAGDTVFDHERRFDRDIDLGPALVGKKLTIVSVVTDTNPQTNRTSMTYQLHGGPTKSEHTSEFTVDQDNDSVMYVAEIELQ